MTEREQAIAQYKLIQSLIDLAGVTKIRGTFIKAFLKSIQKEDGHYYLHGSYNQGGTVCTTRDTLFNTSKGMIPLFQLKIGDSVLTENGNYSPVAAITDVGLQSAYRITTTQGRVLTTTPKHKYKVGRQWINACELQIGQEVIVYGDSIEKWKCIVDWGNYEISSMGRVRNKTTGRILINQVKPPYGHLKVTLNKNGITLNSRKNGGRKDKYIHSLVAEAFLPPPLDASYEVAHINGLPWDNQIQNLAWKTSKENSVDSIKHGTAYKGETKQAKLNWDKVHFIRKQASQLQLNNQQIANLLSVSRELVRDIRNEKRWIMKTTKDKLAVFATDIISKIEKLNTKRRMYGVSVLDTHSHMTNGILTHNSGRLSSSGPNLTNLPSNSEHSSTVKQCFVPPEGWLWMGIDYNSLEDMISALTTKDPNKLKVYEDGLDGHSYRAFNYFRDMVPDIQDTIESINSIADKYPVLRQNSKAPTFLLTYGGTKFGLMNQCGLSREDAERIEKEYHALYAVADQWVADKLEGAASQGYITTAFGLRVRTPILKQIILGNRSTPYEGKAESRTAGNALGQGYGMLNLRASIEFQRRLINSEYKYKIRLICQIHDSQYYLVKDEVGAVKWFNDNIVECIQWQKLPEIQHPTVKLGGSVEIFHPSWDEHFKIPNFASKAEILNTAQQAVDEHLQ